MNLNLSEARVGINYALSEFMIGYEHAERVASFLFPVVRVNLAGGQTIEFDKSSFKRYNSRRAPGAGTVRVNFGYAGRPYSLYQDALEVPMPDENIREARNALNVDLGQSAAQFLMDNLTLTHELDAAAIAQNPSNYASSNQVNLSGTDKFSDPASKPIEVVDEAKNAVRQKIGRKPNVIIVGPQAHVATKNNTQIVERFRVKDNEPVTISNEMLARVFEVDMYIEGQSIWVDDAGNSLDVWGNNMILAYVPRFTLAGNARFSPNPATSIMVPSYGYTYTMADPVLNPYMKTPYWDENCESWIYKGKYERAPLMTGQDAGYLIQGVA